MSSNEKTESENLLDFIVELAPALQKLVPLDCMIAVTDTQKYLRFVPGEKIMAPIDLTGTNIPKVDTLNIAINSGKPERMVVPKEAIGQQQAAATQELASTMEELVASADFLEQSANNVIG